MITKYVVELKPYSFREICGLLECSDEAAKRILKELKAYKVLKELRSKDINRDLADLIDESLAVEEVDSNGNLLYYAFCYVGVIKVAGCIFLCVPKYLSKPEHYHEKLKQVIQVLKLYNSKKQIISLFNDIDDQHVFNDLAVYLYLLEDYYESGIYSNNVDVLEINGNGSINWNRTIDMAFALIHENRPYYTELYTRRRRQNDFDFFRRLHECVLTLASIDLARSGIADLFDITPVFLSEQSLDGFGEREYILYRIQNELNVQFNTRKQLVLKALYAFVSEAGNSSAADNFSMFGTNSFNLVWEDVCAQVLDDMLDNQLSGFSIPSLRAYIAKPKWYAKQTEEDPGQLIAETETLEPDIVVLTRSADNEDARFAILDAKYYCLTLEPGKAIKGNPGIESVSKQYFYELAFAEFIKQQRIQGFANCFLFPTENEDFKNIGYVEFSVFDNLSPIQVLLLPADIMFQNYLNGRKVTLEQIGVKYSCPRCNQL